MDWNGLSYAAAVLEKLEHLLTPSNQISREPQIGPLRPDAIVQRDDDTQIVIECKYVPPAAGELHFSSVAQAAAYGRALEGYWPGRRIRAIVVTNVPVSERLRAMADRLSISIRSVGTNSLDSDVERLAADLTTM